MQLNLQDLKNILHTNKVTQLDAALLLLAHLGKTSAVADIRKAAVNAGIQRASKWHIAGTLSKSEGKAILVPAGWELSTKGNKYLSEKSFIQNPVRDTATSLRVLLSKISDSDSRSFMEEAIECFENKLWRGAVVLSWVGAVSLLQQEIVKKHLAAFNAEAKKRDAKWKDAKTTDDLSLMKEGEFLDILVQLSVLGKNLKEKLKNECLANRNACGHPNSCKIGQHVVMAHLEVLTLNIYNKF